MPKFTDTEIKTNGEITLSWVRAMEQQPEATAEFNQDMIQAAKRGVLHMYAPLYWQ